MHARAHTHTLSTSLLTYLYSVFNPNKVQLSLTEMKMCFCNSLILNHDNYSGEKEKILPISSKEQ